MKKRMVLIVFILIAVVFISSFKIPTIKATDSIVTNLRGSGTKYEPYVIYGFTDLVELSNNVNRGISFENKYILLVNDVDGEGAEFTPIGTKENPFKGLFYGNNHTVSNIMFSQYNESIGLFGYIGESTITAPTVVDLIVSSPVIQYKSSGEITAQTNIGLLVGTQEANTIIDNCYVKDGVIGFDNRTAASASEPGVLYLGGLAGYSEGTITNTIVEASIDAAYSYSGSFDPTSVSDSYSFKSAVGGIAGYTSGEIVNSMINSNYIKLEFGYNSSTVSSEPMVGGVAGYVNGAIISNTYSYMPSETTDNLNYYIAADSLLAQTPLLSSAKIGTQFGVVQDGEYNYVYGCWTNSSSVTDSTKIRPDASETTFTVGETLGLADTTNCISCVPFDMGGSYSIYANSGPNGADSGLLIDFLGQWVTEADSTIYSSWELNTDKSSIPYLKRDITSHIHHYNFSTDGDILELYCDNGDCFINNTVHSARINFDESAAVYTGSNVEPISLTYDETWPTDLIPEISYENNITPSAEALCYFTYGAKQVDYLFEITTCTLDESWFSVEEDQHCTGSNVEPEVIDSSGRSLVPGTDYTITYENNVNVGQGKITIEGINSCTGTVVLYFNLTCPGHDYQYEYDNLTHSGVCTYCSDVIDEEEHNHFVITKDSDMIAAKCGDCDFSTFANVEISKTISLIYDGTAKEIYTIIPFEEWPSNLSVDLVYSNNVNAGIAKGIFQVTDATDNKNVTEIEFEFEIAICQLNKEWFSIAETEQLCTGEAVEPELIDNSGRSLVLGTDYTVEYENNISAGQAVITITGINNYSGNLTLYFNLTCPGHDYKYQYDSLTHFSQCIYCLDILVEEEAHSHFTISKDVDCIIARCEECGFSTCTNIVINNDISLVYDGTAKVIYAMIPLMDWPSSLSISSVVLNNINAGTAKEIFSVTDATDNNKVTEIEFEYEITPCELSEEWFIVDKTLEYTGEAIYPNISTECDFDLILDTDYSLIFNESIDIGMKSVTIEGKGNFKGTITIQYEIVHTIHQEPSEFEYDSELHWKKCTVCDEFIVNENHEFVITIEDNELILKCTTCSFESTATVLVTDETYDGTEKETVQISYSPSWPQSLGVEIGYENNVNAGKAKAYVYILDSTFEFDFNIAQKAFIPETFSSIESAEYTGQAIEPSVSCSDTTLVNGRDYTVSYLNNINIGTASIVITPSSNYTGEVVINFEIIHTIHQYPTEWTFDDVYHWKECSICDEIAYKELHSGDEYCDTCSHELEKFETKKDILDTQEKIDNLINGETDDPDLKDAIDNVDEKVIEDVTNKSKDELNKITEDLDNGLITQEEAKKRAEIVEIGSKTALIIINNQQNELNNLNEKEDEVPIDISSSLESFYNRQYEILLGFDSSISIETYNSVVEFTDSIVSNMKNAVGTLHECDGEEAHLEVNRFVESLSVKTFRDFNKEEADREFVKLAYQAILLHLQEQTLVIIEETYQEAVASGTYQGKQLTEIKKVYEESKTLVADIDSFEDVVLGVLQEKYITLIDLKYQDGVFTLDERNELINEATDNEKFEEIYHNIFESWALNKNEYEITLEELTTTVVNNYGKDTIQIEVNDNLTSKEVIAISSIAGSMGIFSIVYFILRRKVGVL